ncbi:hypothetical protein ACFO0S_09475 [Chryseomicrobium palamuruense]|uniref:Flagellar protein FlgN n=1 Tax=Chryseomicrobium palamuruense TaxID=682973 RepID=A0ABV8UWD5_9BACL
MSHPAERLISSQQQLLDLAKRKEQSIISRHVDRINELNKQEVLILKQISQLEKEGISSVSEDLLLKSQQLQDELKQQLALNEQLLKDALQFTTQMISHLTGDHQNPNYSKSNESKSAKSMAFDSKA